MTKKTKQYSAQEKTTITLEALKGELTIAQISSYYGVHATQINRSADSEFLKKQKNPYHQG